MVKEVVVRFATPVYVPRITLEYSAVTLFCPLAPKWWETGGENKGVGGKPGPFPGGQWEVDLFVKNVLHICN
jgi:hypothetical protein